MQEIDEIRGRVVSTAKLPKGEPWDFWRTAGVQAVEDRAVLLAEIERLGDQIGNLADHLDQEGQAVDGPTMARVLLRIVEGSE